jgi:flagellar M-ring protein FliF
MAGFNDATEQARQFWASRNPGQKGLLLAGTAATVVLLTLFVRLIGAPDYKPLYTGLEAADAQTLTAQLDAQGIAHEASADGKTISVPADKLDAARLQTASQGAPHSGRMGFELFDKMSWGQTEFDEKVTYQRALEGELERTIQTLDDVESARVHLVMPSDSVFADQDHSAKASVILKLRHGSLSKDAVTAISRLVSGAVDELKPENVSIVDADSDRSLGQKSDTQGDGEVAESTLTARLISTLEPVVGVDKIRASVNVDYDQGTTEESQEKYDPTVSAVLSEQKTQDQSTTGNRAAATQGASGLPANAPGAGGVPGTTSNVPSKETKPASQPTQTSGQTSKFGQHAVWGKQDGDSHHRAGGQDPAGYGCNSGGRCGRSQRGKWQGDLQEVQAVAGRAGQDPAVGGGGDRLRREARRHDQCAGHVLRFAGGRDGHSGP